MYLSSEIACPLFLTLMNKLKNFLPGRSRKMGSVIHVLFDTAAWQSLLSTQKTKLYYTLLPYV